MTEHQHRHQHAGQQTHQTSQPPQTQDHDEFWAGHYGQRGQIWSGKVNARLAEVLEAVAPTPGRALDVGCGEGGDVVWLAQHGWQVTGVDISQVALDRAQAAADAADLSEHVTFERHDLTRTFPDGEFDLVSAQFLQSPLEFDRGAMLRRAARAVAAGGIVVVVEHGQMPPWSQHPEPEGGMPTAEQTLASLDLASGQWEVLRSDSPAREVTDPEGRQCTLLDNVIVARRQ